MDILYQTWIRNIRHGDRIPDNGTEYLTWIHNIRHGDRISDNGTEYQTWMHNIRYGNRIPDNETEYQTWYRKSAGRPKEALNSPLSCREAGVSLCKKFHSYVRAWRNWSMYRLNMWTAIYQLKITLHFHFTSLKWTLLYTWTFQYYTHITSDLLWTNYSISRLSTME